MSLISDSGYFFMSWVVTPWVFIDCKGSGLWIWDDPLWLRPSEGTFTCRMLWLWCMIFEFDRIFHWCWLYNVAVDSCILLQPSAMYCIYSIAVFGYLMAFRFFDISTGRNSYICCSQVLWNLLGRFHTAKGGVDILLVEWRLMTGIFSWESDVPNVWLTWKDSIRLKSAILECIHFGNSCEK